MSQSRAPSIFIPAPELEAEVAAVSSGGAAPSSARERGRVVVQRLLEQVLPPLQVRIRKRRIPVLVDRIMALSASPGLGMALGDSAHSFADASEDKPGRLATLGVLLIRVIAAVQVELAELDKTIAAHVDAYARARTPELKQRRLEAMIDETAATRRDARKDRRALRRHLDLDALRERFDDRRERLLVLIELAILALGPALRHALALASDPERRDELRELLQHAEPARFLVEQLPLLRPWPTRLALLESLDNVLEALGTPPSSQQGSGHRRAPGRELGELVARLVAIGRDRNEHEWVQARAITTLRRLSLHDARALIRERLLLDADPSALAQLPPRDFLVRRLLIADLARSLDDPADLALLERALERGEPSEFARVGHCKALVPLALARPSSFVLWAQWLARGPSTDSGSPAEETYRVRAWALAMLVQAVRSAIDRGAAPEQLDVLVEVVAERLRDAIAREQVTLVALIACEQAIELGAMLARTPLAPRLPALLASFEDPLHRCLADGERPAKIHETAAATLEALDRALRPERIAWTDQLRGAIDAVEPGRAALVRAPVHEGRRPDDIELGRMLAELTRDDWGLDVEPSSEGEHLWVRRGEHQTTRAWRIIHELRNLSSNKRQAFRHTTGREFLGRVRAHPGRLDEVTATVVPGERLQIDLEGGWGRQLPLVDDVIGLPWLSLRRRALDREVRVHSSYGVTRLRLRGGLFTRLRRRLLLNLAYPRLSELRRRVLLSDEPVERRRYIDELRDRFGVDVRFEPNPPLPLPEASPHPIPPRVAALFPAQPLRPMPLDAVVVTPQASVSQQVTAPSLATMAALAGFGEYTPFEGEWTSWMRGNLHYFLTLEGNSQEALGLYGLALFAFFLGTSHLRRRAVASARAAIPLSIGGWGTRGKSGTERLKAGMFHGLGFRTFSKTTGCEAMFIHAAPTGSQTEIFTFRPYNKATIWEQRNLLELAAGLEAEVFLWECMALNPEYVDIMQRGWMRDDYATITNTYPDHEDVQGPAGLDVATVIGNFVPQGTLVVSSELGFNPVLRAAAKRRECEFITIGDHDGDLLTPDLLSLFPYSEHPRNIALVTELAHQMGIDEELAIVCMADYVYPDLGVLKFYPEVVVRGRRLNFVNGCSANERAGFLNNWKRTGCVELAAKADPERMVITVVNNRDDRVARSEVFSRILVNDVTVDAHVLIGTNLAGLSIFIDRALENFVGSQEILDGEGLREGGEAHERARKRLRTLFARVRAPIEGWWDTLCGHLRCGFASIGRGYDLQSPAARAFHDLIDRMRCDDRWAVDYDGVFAELGKDKQYSGALHRLFEQSREDVGLIHPDEVLATPTFDDFAGHLQIRVARMIAAGRLALRLEQVLGRGDQPALTELTQKILRSWTQMFRSQVNIVWDSGASGDQIIERCAKAVMPGVHVTIMGTQNIKGTGLDFIYRWLSLDLAHTNLAKLSHPDEQVRLDALRVLDGNSDNGFTDTGVLRVKLPRITGGSPQEQNMRLALLEKSTAIWKQKIENLASSGDAASKGGRLWIWVEQWIDFIDGAVRYWESRQLVDDLIHFRISHNKMAVQMREIYARAKGGWLSKKIAAWWGARGRKKALAETK